MDFFGKATGRFWKLGAQSQELGVADHRLLTSEFCPLISACGALASVGA